eukprot:200461_1
MYQTRSRTKQAKANQKRKAPDNDEFIGNETKRMKLNTNTVSSDDDSNTNSIDSSTALCSSMQSALDNVKTILNSTEHDQSQMKLFVQQLCAVSSAHDAKWKELEYRKTALSNLLDKLKSKGRTFCKFGETMLMGLRFDTFKTRTTHEMYCTQHYEDYSLDIALRCSDPHSEYIRKMNKLLKPYIGGVKDICSIICEYSQNGYRWYRLSVTQQTDDEYENTIPMLNDGIMFSLDFDTLDYFTDNTYYKAPPRRRSRSTPLPRLVKFGTLRKELDREELWHLNRRELSERIGCIVDAAFNLNLLPDYTDWIEQCHKSNMY